MKLYGGEGCSVKEICTKYEYWLAAAKGISAREKRQLLDLFDSPKELYQIAEAWGKGQWGQGQPALPPSLSERVCDALGKAREGKDWEKEYEHFLVQGIRLISWNHPEYPRKLREIYDPPFCLYVKGKLPAEGQKTVAVVGARSCSAYGQAVAEYIGKQLALSGVGVISGLAYGIDAAAHRGAVVGGAAYGVLGCGVDICYPKANGSLYRKVIETGGVLSEYPPGSQPRREFFPRRNRIISGLSDAVIVVEAKKKSGSLITADCALEQGRNVYAVPGRISDSLSYGTNWLMSQGAEPLFDLEEFLEEMDIKSEKNKIPKNFIENPLEKNERLVYSVLDLTPKHLEAVIEETGLDFSEAVHALYGLMRYGYIKEIYKNHYISSL